MKIVVTGASGMLGNAIYRQLRERREDVEGWSLSTRRASGHSFRRVSDVEGWPYKDLDLLVHCAAYTDADWCEENPASARSINAFWPGDLAADAKKVGARFVYVSTDAVYNDEGPGRRKEEDQPFPQSVYASSKLEGEGRVLAAYPDALVVRTTMFGWTLPTAPRPKFAEQILGALSARRQTKLFRDAIFSPLHVDMLGEILLELGEHSTASGVLNVGARYPISKADFGARIAETFGLDASFIERGLVDDVPLKARRTKNTGLDVKKVEKLLGPMPRVEDGISQLYVEAFDGTAQKIRGRETYP